MIDFDSGYRMVIDADLVETSAKLPVVNPASEEVFARAPEASRADLERAVRAARGAQPKWRETPLAERQRRVTALGEAIRTHAEAFQRLLTREQGKPRAGAVWEVEGSAGWCAGLASLELPRHVVEDTAEHRIETRRVPIGVVGAIVPWNFPILLAVWKIAPALLMGNTVVLKPSPFTPLCTLKLGELARDLFPPGVLNVLSGGDALGRWMTEHPGIDKISFTGSSETGKHVMRSAATNLKRITLELGGNDPAIVLPDADPAQVAPQLFWAAFQNSGQFCVACKRLYLHEEIYDDVARALVDCARKVRVGDGSLPDSELGPLQNRPQFEKVCALIEDTHRRGLRFLVGGSIEDRPGYFVPVSLVDDPPDDAPVVTEEAFGPLLPLLRFRSIDEVVSRANTTRYGLAASIWTRDLEAAPAIAERLEAGTVWINEVHVFAPNVAFGGHKESGIGVENALDGLAEYTNVQTVMVRR